MKCQNCENEFESGGGLRVCNKDVWEGHVIYICPYCKHGNYFY